MMRYILIILLVVILVTLNTMQLPSSDEGLIVEISDIRPEQYVMKGFTLDRAMEVEIDAVTGVLRSHEKPLSSCWMLNSETRRIIWECDFEEGELSPRGRKLYINQRINLPAGNYEVYYALNPSPDKKIQGIGDFINYLLGDSDDPSFKEWGIKIKATDAGDASGFYHAYYPVKKNDAIVSMKGLQDDESVKEGFSISEPLKVRIYAIGEGMRKRRQMYDYGWIVDAKSRKRVWEMTYRNTDHAGGARKNLMFDDIIKLPAGDYLVYFITDDSHSARHWNQMPPYDPQYWGITLWAIDKGKGRVEVRDFEKFQTEPIIELTHIRNDQMEMEGVYLEKGGYFNIYAIGEYSRSRRNFVDHGWIMHAYTRETIMEMNYNNTQHAGGARKNRVFDDRIYLDAGPYLVFYESDDSHAYNQWNARKPFQPEKWGITIYPAEPDFSVRDFQEYQEYRDRNILAQIIEVGNHEKLNADFYLSRRSEIRIYAIGEGDHSEMYDYAWIENSRRKVVWEMEFDYTEHAGGAKKNRLVNEVIRLDKGTYRVFYKTDDSHSYRRWNSSPPRDRIHWGVTIIRNN
ncbi:hypothetical protein GF337_19695 [candidate division KSB1 bacterium]|nr:hypothetical protein [candidate division KSB1 bacterium]